MGSGKGAGKSNKDLKTLHLHQDKKSGHWFYPESPPHRKKLAQKETRKNIKEGFSNTIRFACKQGFYQGVAGAAVAGTIRGAVDFSLSQAWQQYSNTLYNTIPIACGIGLLTYGISRIRDHDKIKQEESVLKSAEASDNPFLRYHARINAVTSSSLEKKAKLFMLCGALLTAALTFQHNKPVPKNKKTQENARNIPAALISKDSGVTYSFN